MDGIRSDPLPAVPTAALIDQITELAGHLNAGTYRWLTLIAEFDRRLGWNCGLTKSCAHWLNWKCGLDLGAAREKVRVAHALESLPLISAAMARGELSYSKVRALTRVACAGTEAALLSVALHGTASHVEKLVRHYPPRAGSRRAQARGASVQKPQSFLALRRGRLDRDQGAVAGRDGRPRHEGARRRARAPAAAGRFRGNVSGPEARLGAAAGRCARGAGGELSRARPLGARGRRAPADRRAR